MRELLVRFDIADVENPLEPGRMITMDTFTIDGVADQKIETLVTVGARRFQATGRVHRIGTNHFGIEWESIVPA